MRITEVTNRALLKQFVRFPDRLYRDCPQYVPALHQDQVRTLTHNAALQYCRQKLWLCTDDEGKVLGRICAIVNPRYNELYGKKCCRFGWFDTVEDFEVARTLIETAENWARAEGMTQIHGPLFYNTLGKQGMLVEGFDKLPQFNNIYNFPYYPLYLERLGFVKECDWVQYVMEGHSIPERLEKISSRLMERYRLHFGSVEKLKKDKERVREFFRMYSGSFSRSVYNFIPFTEAEIEEEAQMCMPMLSDRYTLLLMDENDELAAFGITVPSVSRALQKARGSLFPFGWIHLLRALRCHNDSVDLLLTGSVGEWAGKGVSAVLHSEVGRRWREMGILKSVSNPQIETNPASKVWESYTNGEPYIRRRCYIKNIY